MQYFPISIRISYNFDAQSDSNSSYHNILVLNPVLIAIRLQPFHTPLIMTKHYTASFSLGKFFHQNSKQHQKKDSRRKRGPLPSCLLDQYRKSWLQLTISRKPHVQISSNHTSRQHHAQNHKPNVQESCGQLLLLSFLFALILIRQSGSHRLS